MTFAYWMVLAAGLLPYFAVVLAKSGGIDNRAPRQSLAKLTGWRQRADWAQRNHFEAFPLFAAAVIIAELARAPQHRIDLLAGAFIALRVLYTAMYVLDRSSLRTIVWALGLMVVIGLFVLAA